MIIKKLRESKSWSQEQLAIMSGLSTRTIQRIESGNKASIELLKSIAAVFEVDVLTLTKEITVIDKESSEWKAEPLWLRYQFMFIKNRKQALFGEYFLILMGLFLGLYYAPQIAWVAFLGAYLFSKLHHRLDTKKLW